MNEQLTPQQDVLENIQQEWEYEDASKGQRFANYLIDFISFYAIIFAIAFLAAALIPGAAESLSSLEGSSAIVDRIVTMLLFAVYMALIEGIFKGKTLSKLITGTTAIQENGENITFSNALRRGFSRIVPLEPLSAFGYRPWHDKWTATRVVKNQ